MNQDLKKTLWAAADKLRSSMDAAEYKHIVLGLIFLKYISDAFTERREALLAAFADPENDLYLPDSADHAEMLEERDYYTMANVFWVPEKARWESIRAQAKQPDIGTRIDAALDAIESDNPRLKNILDKRYGRAQLEPGKLGELIDLVATIGFGAGSHAKDVLGEVYEYFLGQFASAEGKKGGQFYTPGSVVKVLVEVLAPHKGKVYDPCCGSGGMFVQSEKFIESHGGKFGDISIYGQEANPTTWRLVAMNLAIRGMDFNLGKEPADTFHRDQHPDLKADYVLANPPFNISDWGGDRLIDDKRWMYGSPPAGNANFAWLQHILHHLGPKGQAGIVLANGSMTSTSNNEGLIRQRMIEHDVVEVMIALPGQLFFNTPIAACLWFLAKDKTLNGRDRRNEVLFIDARRLELDAPTRTSRVLPDDAIARIAATVAAWRRGDSVDEPGYCQVASSSTIAAQGYNLSPSLYIPGVPADESDELFEERMEALTAQLSTQFANISKLSDDVKCALESLGYAL